MGMFVEWTDFYACFRMPTSIFLHISTCLIARVCIMPIKKKMLPKTSEDDQDDANSGKKYHRQRP